MVKKLQHSIEKNQAVVAEYNQPQYRHQKITWRFVVEDLLSK